MKQENREIRRVRINETDNGRKLRSQVVRNKKRDGKRRDWFMSELCDVVYIN